MFGPNSRFLTYISDVLPSLGENDVQMATLADLMNSEAPKTEPDQLARIKGRTQLAEGLACWVRARGPSGVPLEVQTAHGTVFLAPDRADAARCSALREGIGHNRAPDLFTEHIVADLVGELERQTAKELSDLETEIKVLMGIDLDRMFAADHLRRLRG